MTRAETVIWHELECGIYREDLAFWRGLARDAGDPVLDVGAGTGRVSLDLARHGHRVVAVDLDPELLAELRRHATHLATGDALSGTLTAVCADARALDLPERDFPLIIVPMQTIQLLGGPAGRAAFLARAREHLVDGGVLAISIAPEFEEFDAADGHGMPLPDIVELDGSVYCSQPTAVRSEGATVVIERVREVVDPAGVRRVTDDRIVLDQLGTAELIAEATRVGLRAVGTHTVAATDEHIGSLVVILRA